MNRIKIYQCKCQHCQTMPHNSRQWIIQNDQPGLPHHTRRTFQAALLLAAQ